MELHPVFQKVSAFPAQLDQKCIWSFDYSSKSPGLWYRSHVSGWIWQIQGTVGQKATISSLSADWSKQMIPSPVGFYILQPSVNTALKTKSTWCVLQRDRWHACTDTEQTSQSWDETWPGRGKILQNVDSISIRRLPMTRESKPTTTLPFGLAIPGKPSLIIILFQISCFLQRVLYILSRPSEFYNHPVSGCGLHRVTCLSGELRPPSIATQIHKYTNTQIHTMTNTQWHNDTNARIKL